jgi:hypothetical protein
MLNHVEVPKLFKDEFYLQYLSYLGKAEMSIYSVAIPLVTREDIRAFFVRCLQDTAKLITAVTETALSKNVIMNTPVIPSPTS